MPVVVVQLFYGPVGLFSRIICSKAAWDSVSSDPDRTLRVCLGAIKRHLWQPHTINVF